MRRRNRWGLYGVGLVLVWLALVLSEWLPRPTAAERDALTALAVEPESLKGERDGFAAIWLMGFDVPEDQLAQVLQADIAAYEKMLAQTGSVSEFQTSAQGKFATVAFPSGKDPALCELWKEDCLDRVRRAPDVARKRLAEFSTRLTRSRWLANYDHFHYAFTPRFESPIASLGGLTNLQLTVSFNKLNRAYIDSILNNGSNIGDSLISKMRLLTQTKEQQGTALERQLELTRKQIAAEDEREQALDRLQQRFGAIRRAARC